MFKKIKLSLALIAGLATFGIYSCGDGLAELNVDPNNPTSVPVENLITQAQQQLNNRMWSRGINAEWGMLMVQHWAQNEYAEESRYTVDGNDFDLEWLDLYADVLNELNVAKGLVDANDGLSAGQKANQLAVISLLREYTFHNLTDMYGALPYTSALNPEESPLPTYDSQSDIYNSIVANVTAAVNSIDAGSDGFTTGDAIFNGNMGAWKKFGASFLMRVALRMSNVNSGKASDVMNGINAADLITTNSDNALFVFDANPDIANPLFVDANIDGRDDFAVSDVLIDKLKAMGDPRLFVYADTTNSGTYIGMPYGLTDGEAFDLKSTTSRPNPAVRGATVPAVMIDAAEVNFMIAEARERGILPGSAAEAYAAGVTASMEFWGFNDAAGAITDYIAANPYDGMQSIGTQKWFAFYTNGPQAWAEQRRLDIPVLSVPAAATNPVIPVRLPYPISEQERNGTELGKVTSNPNDLSTKLWWDVN